MNNNKTNLLNTSNTSDQLELLADHGIDPTLFADWTIYIGLSDDFAGAIEKWGHEKWLNSTHGQTGYRANIGKLESLRLLTGENGWSIYSVQLNKKGYPQEGKAYLGHRIHPSNRTDEGIKFDCSGFDPVNRGLMLPPLSLYGATELLGDHGFRPDPEGYDPWQAWEYVYKHPEIPIWVEESALKAMAACSVGQLAIGLNGINSFTVKGRSSRLVPALKRLAPNRKIIARFDCAESMESQSKRQAHWLYKLLSKAGSRGGGWWNWPEEGPHKTDDFVAALITEQINKETRKLLDTHLDDSSPRQNYTRIKNEWPAGNIIDREFEAIDILYALQTHRIICLKGATGTAKSKAMVAAVEGLETNLIKLIVLGGYHLASLVHKGAKEYGVCSMSAPYGSAERRGLHEGAILRDGCFCCGESAYKITGEKTLWDWYWDLLNNPRPAVLILDEISQVLPNWTIGGTEGLKHHRNKAIAALTGLIKLDCVKVIAADALLGDVELSWLKNLTNEEPYLLRSTFTRSREIYLGDKDEESERILALRLLAIARSNGRIWLGHGTLKGLYQYTNTLLPYYQETSLMITGEKSSKADQRVIDFMADAEHEGPKYGLIAYSPAMSCGTSMANTPVDISAIVQDFQWKAEDVLQAVNRARQSEQRVLLTPNFVHQAVGVTKATTPYGVQLALAQKIEGSDVAFFKQIIGECDPATRQAILELEARNNYECYNNQWCLKSFLLEEGYILKDISELLVDTKTEQAVGVIGEPKSLSTEDDFNLYKKLSLQRLAKGESTIEQEQQAAKSKAEGGLFYDYLKIDVSLAWKLAQELALDKLAKAGTVHNSSPEILETWNRLCAVDGPKAKSIARELGANQRNFPAHGDKIEVRTIWPMVKAIGFKQKKCGQTRLDGNVWQITPIPQTPPITPTKPISPVNDLI